MRQLLILTLTSPRSSHEGGQIFFQRTEHFDMFAYKVSDSIGEFNIFHVLRNCICIFSVILSLCSFSLYVIFYFCYFRVLAATVHFAVNRFLFLRLMDIVNM